LREFAFHVLMCFATVITPSIDPPPTIFDRFDYIAHSVNTIAIYDKCTSCKRSSAKGTQQRRSINYRSCTVETAPAIETTVVYLLMTAARTTCWKKARFCETNEAKAAQRIFATNSDWLRTRLPRRLRVSSESIWRTSTSVRKASTPQRNKYYPVNDVWSQKRYTT
jgi:hypothetical protein